MSFSAVATPDWLVPLTKSLGDSHVLDTNFGDGQRFLRAWQHWRTGSPSSERLFFTGLCDTLTPEALQTSFQDMPADLAPLAEMLLAHWPLAVPGIHRVLLENGRISLTLVLANKDLPNSLGRISARFDLIWTTPPPENNHLAKNAVYLARICNTNTVLFSLGDKTETASLFKKALIGAGFAINPNPSNAAQFTAFFRANHTRKTFFAHASNARRTALVIGAGLAGTAVATSLAQRGWGVTVLERNTLPAQGASGNLAAVLSPMLSKDDGLAARLSRTSFLRLLEELRSLDAIKFPNLWAGCGKLQLARSEKEEAHFQELAQHHRYPESHVRYLTREHAGSELGHAVYAGGLLFPEGGWVAPAILCEIRLTQSPGVQLRSGCGVLEIVQTNEGWSAKGANGATLGTAGVLILANAFEAAQFAPASFLHMKKVRGQVTHLPQGSIPAIKRVVGREGYLTPSISGIHSLGATYDFNDDRNEPDLAGHSANLARLPELLAGFNTPIAIQPSSGRVGFRSLTADRLPMIGAMPDFAKSGSSATSKMHYISGLYTALGMGSRGLLWSTCAGEILAAQLSGEPAPVETDLLEAVDPARFLKRGRNRTYSVAV